MHTEQQKLHEQKAATDAARNNLTCFCDRHIYHDITTGHPMDAQQIKESVDYLESRGLAMRHPQDNNLVRVLNAPLQESSNA